MNYALLDSYLKLSHRQCLWFSFTPPSKPFTVAGSSLDGPPPFMTFVHKSLNRMFLNPKAWEDEWKRSKPL